MRLKLFLTLPSLDICCFEQKVHIHLNALAPDVTLSVAFPVYRYLHVFVLGITQKMSNIKTEFLKPSSTLGMWNFNQDYFE